MKTLITLLAVSLVSISSFATNFTVSCTSLMNPDKEITLFITDGNLVQLRVQSNGLPMVLPFTKISTQNYTTEYNVMNLGLVSIDNKIFNDRGGRLTTTNDNFNCM
jgi:hypothetical protein